MLSLKLDKPIVFFDLETTGTRVAHDRVVELSVIKLLPSGEKEVKTRRLNPEMPIPPQATAIHGIGDADVADAPTFKAISKNLYIYLEGCDLGGYNVVRFDIPVLINEFRRAGLDFSVENRRVVDPFVIFCKMEPRTLSAAYKLFCGKELEGAHGAEADVLATIEVLDGQLSKYDDLPRNLEELHDFCDQSDPDWLDSTGKFKWENDEVRVNFGKNSGTGLKEIAVQNPGFLRWMINADFPEDAKKIATDALAGTFPEKADASADE